MEVSELKYLQIKSEISIEPVTGRIPKHPPPFLCLIMGPTGAGKSSIIEALAGESQQLLISKDQLAGYTQAVNGYRLMNVTLNVTQPVYLIDTPGFSDSKISEIEILSMVKRWLKDNDLTFVHRILFLIPITQTRLTGSRRKTIKMLQQLIEPSRVAIVTFVTTMWDKLHNERTQKSAESKFEQLRDEVCKDFFGELKVSITRFANTRSSALEVLDADCRIEVDSTFNSISSASPNLYQDLHERIEGALQAKQMVEAYLTQPDVQTNAELRAILEKNQMENHETLAKFIVQLIHFGPPPFTFNQAAQRLRKAIASQITLEDPQCMETFKKWEQEPEILQELVPDSKPVPSPEPFPHASEKLTLEGLLRRLLNAAKRRGSKWFKRKA